MAVGLLFCDGFDQWGFLFEVLRTQNNNGLPYSFAGLGPTSLVATGARAGAGQCYQMGSSSTDDFRLTTFCEGAGASVSDGTSVWMGFNVYLGAAATGTATGGYCRVWGLSNTDPGSLTGGGTLGKVNFWYDKGLNSFEVSIGTSGTVTSGAGQTVVATGTPTRNPWKQWTYIELGIYRSATSGTVDMFIQTASGGLEHVLAATALNTSVASLGTINRWFFAGGRRSSATFFSYNLDDLWVAFQVGVQMTQGLGAPAYVVTVAPASDSTSTGGWTSTTGTNHFDGVDEQPNVETDYTYIDVTATGLMTTAFDFYGQSAWPYTPNNIYGMQAVVFGIRTGTGGTSGASTATMWAGINQGGTTFCGGTMTLNYASSSAGGVLGTTGATNVPQNTRLMLELNPSTSGAWSLAAAQGLTFGPMASGHAITNPAPAGSQKAACFGAAIYALVSQATGAVVTGGAGSGTWAFFTPNAG